MLSANVSAKVCDKDIDDIMCAALEGGITYWCEHGQRLSENISENMQASRSVKAENFVCMIAESDEVYTLTLDKFLRGLATYIGQLRWLCC